MSPNSTGQAALKPGICREAAEIAGKTPQDQGFGLQE